jgi:hypothetical protein
VVFLEYDPAMADDRIGVIGDLTDLQDQVNRQLAGMSPAERGAAAREQLAHIAMVEEGHWARPWACQFLDSRYG